MPSFISWTLQIILLHVLFSKNGHLAYFHCILRFEIFPSVHHTSYCIFHHEDLFSQPQPTELYIHLENALTCLLHIIPAHCNMYIKAEQMPAYFLFCGSCVDGVPITKMPAPCNVRYPLSWYCRWPREPTDNRKRYLTIIMFVFGAIATKIHIMIFYYQSIKSSVRRYNII